MMLRSTTRRWPSALVKTGRLAVLAAAAMVWSASSQAEVAQVIERPAAQQPHGLSVTGHGEVRTAPDMATISIGVVTEDRSARAAAAANAQAAHATAAAMHSHGVADADIQTSDYGIEPLTTQPTDTRRPTITGYRVTNTVRVRVRALDQLGSLIDAASTAGANVIYGVSFGLSDRSAAEDEALAAAIKNARRKADRAAAAAGVRIAGIASIQEGGAGRPPEPVMFAARAAMMATPISAGETTIAEDVTVVFDIAPAVP